MSHRYLPVNFWLLLAATVSLDLVATYELFDSGNNEATALFLGMAYGQISLLCVWAVAERSRTKARWLAPVGAAMVVVCVMTWGDAIGRGHFAWDFFATITCLLMIYIG